MVPVDEIDAGLRLLAACGCGMLIGANRGLQGKPTGMRTLGLVSLGAALVTVVTIRVPGMQENADAMSRVIQGVIQGVLTGIGFLGAGVVLRDRTSMEIHGLTTAASVWITAALGIACALASWSMVVIAVAIAMALLVLMHPIDRWLQGATAEQDSPEGGGSPAPQDEVSSSTRR